MLFQAGRVYSLLGGFLSHMSFSDCERRVRITYINNDLSDEPSNSASCLAFGKQAPGSAPGGIFLHAVGSSRREEAIFLSQSEKLMRDHWHAMVPAQYYIYSFVFRVFRRFLLCRQHHLLNSFKNSLGKQPQRKRAEDNTSFSLCCEMNSFLFPLSISCISYEVGDFACLRTP